MEWPQSPDFAIRSVASTPRTQSSVGGFNALQAVGSAGGGGGLSSSTSSVYPPLSAGLGMAGLGMGNMGVGGPYGHMGMVGIGEEREDDEDEGDDCIGRIRPSPPPAASLAAASAAMGGVLAGLRAAANRSASGDSSSYRIGCEGGGGVTSRSTSSSRRVIRANSSLLSPGSGVMLSLDTLSQATNDFHPDNLLGQGALSRVFKGQLDDGTSVAVKVVSRGEGRAAAGGLIGSTADGEFAAEVELLACLNHRNLVKLVGACVDEGTGTRSLVFRYVPHGSVHSHLHGRMKATAGPMGWEKRMKVAFGAARALAYLHDDSHTRVLHGDFKSSNVLLEYDFTPKVSDYGLARALGNQQGSGTAGSQG